MNKIAAAFVLLTPLSLGCLPGVSKSPTRDRSRIPMEPFAIDPEPEPLNTSCLTSPLNGCDESKTLADGIRAMTNLHNLQMKEVDASLRSLSVLLNRADDIPSLRVTAPRLNTRSWVDPDATYPAPLELRMETERGLNRMGADSIDTLVDALIALEQQADTHRSSWNALIDLYPAGLVLPDSVTMERQYTRVHAALQHRSFKFSVPKHLGKKYIKRNVEPWVAVASHVITVPGMRYKAVGEHRQELPPALTVSGKGPFVISETPNARAKWEYNSFVKPSDACKQLRGELRFVRADKAVPLRASFARTSNGGSR